MGMTREEAISILKELKKDVRMRSKIPHVANIIIESLDMAINSLAQHPTCDSCKYYTHRNACRESKNYCYCNRVTTTKMLPDDYCSRWEGKTDDK